MLFTITIQRNLLRWNSSELDESTSLKSVNTLIRFRLNKFSILCSWKLTHKENFLLSENTQIKHIERSWIHLTHAEAQDENIWRTWASLNDSNNANSFAFNVRAARAQCGRVLLPRAAWVEMSECELSSSHIHSHSQLRAVRHLLAAFLILLERLVLDNSCSDSVVRTIGPRCDIQSIQLSLNRILRFLII